MAKPVIADILAKLEPFLDAADRAWEAQPPDLRRPTLPVTGDGKVNVRALTVALGLRQSQEQHFYKHPELAAVVNVIAEVQGVKPIGSRLFANQAESTVADRLQREQRQNSELAKLLAEKEALVERQRREIMSLRERLGLLEETGMLIRIPRHAGSH